MRLGRQIVDLHRPDLADDLDEAIAVDEVTVVQNHLALSVTLWILVQVLKK